nr:nucleolin 1-like [Ipomoea batatas]
MRPVLTMKVLMMSHLKLSVKKSSIGKESSYDDSSSEESSDEEEDAPSKTPKGGRGGGESTTVFVKGFDKNDIEDKIRSALEDHFGCSKSFKLTKVSILVKMRGIDGFTTCYC